MYKDTDIEGWMGINELRWLHDKAQEMQSIVEIGSWKGRSTHALLTGCPGPVYAVDHWLGEECHRDGAHKEALTCDLEVVFRENLKDFDNLRVCRGDSPEVATEFLPQSIDMVFIDGAHEYKFIKADLEAWKDVPTKLLCGHDGHYPPVKTAIAEILEDTPIKMFDSIWYVEL